MQGPLKLSSTLTRRLKMAGGIRVNGRVVRVNEAIGPGDELVLVMEGREAPNVTAEPMELRVVHEDPDLVVLDKPAGIVVHPTHGVYAGTLANGLAHRWTSRGEPAAIHPLHRIDRETSGLVLFARHALAHQRLAEQLEAHDIERSYLALARGRLVDDAGEIDQPIARRPGHPTAREVSPEGQASLTRYEVLARYDDATLLRLRLATGRTHQIRVHLSWLGHPLLGDDLYGEARSPLAPRQALHAATLGFRHPRTGEWTAFEAPWPADLEALKTHLGG